SPKWRSASAACSSGISAMRDTISPGNTSYARPPAFSSTTCRTKTACASRAYCAPTVQDRSKPHPERIEVGTSVEVVLAFRALEEADHAIRDRRHDDLP